MDWTSDSDDCLDGFSSSNSSDGLSWEDDDEMPGPIAGPVPTMRDTSGEAGPSRPSIVTHFMDMGFSEEMVEKAIQNTDSDDAEDILNTLLTYGVLEKIPPEHDEIPAQFSSAGDTSDVEFSDLEVSGGAEEFVEYLSEKDRKLLTLREMGFPLEAASLAINICGQDTSIFVLADFIYAAQNAEEYNNLAVCSIPRSAEDESLISDSHIGKKRRTEEQRKYYRKSFPHRKEADMTRTCLIPKPMIGFGLPYERQMITKRKLPEAASGPPYFYYENVALAPKGVWETMSRFLDDIEPEFVDSKYFCASARKRGYIHNLPIHNRFPLLPMPPRTIQEVLPLTKRWWPSWDTRTHLNCLQTCIASAELTKRIRKALVDGGHPTPPEIQKYVLTECRKWNLVWLGPHTVAPLEAGEMEMILGFPKDHTRGGGVSKTERHKSLGNSFQVDTVAFHLSVLKEMFPDGLKVLSLFSGIGGAEVALHRLGIHLKVVVSVEISKINRNILKCWWDRTNQTGDLIEINDVQKLNDGELEKMINEYHGFDLVIGGSPCNNLTGSNRYSRDGLEGKHSSLFYHYYRILHLVKCITGNK